MKTEIHEATGLAAWAVQLRKGTLGLAVLATLWNEKLYALEIQRKLALGAVLAAPEGTLYPLLNRLKREGLLSSEWVEAEAGHPRKYYSLTPKGREAATWMTRMWWGFSMGLSQVLEPLQADLAKDRSLPKLLGARSAPLEDALEDEEG
jgi:PadR family transcriptional regulator PadR